MDLLSLIIVGIAAIAGGLAVGYYLRLVISLGKRGSMEIEIKRMRLAAEEEAKNITDEAAKKAEKIISDAEREAKEARTELKKTEDRLIKREDLLD